MLKKFGVNSTRQEKDGPRVVSGIQNSFSKMMQCTKCKRKYKKTCESELSCSLSSSICPDCNGQLEAI